ncbi:antA/AntB antirepressor family protein [Bartonella schoenbuchensis]
MYTDLKIEVSEFADWITERIQNYEFKEGCDFR